MSNAPEPKPVIDYGRLEKDKNLQAILEAETSVVTIFGKTWDLHVEKILRIRLEDNLDMISSSVAYLKNSHLEEVHYDAEHFFDGFKENRDYALQTLSAAIKGGADAIGLCDSNGGSLPHEIESIVREVIAYFNSDDPENQKAKKIRFGIHTHNDSSLAVANSIAAVRAGAVIVQGTINGYGERCGNADLTSIIPILKITPAIRSLRVNGADDRLSMKTIETVEFQSARKTSKSRLIALL